MIAPRGVDGPASLAVWTLSGAYSVGTRPEWPTTEVLVEAVRTAAQVPHLRLLRVADVYVQAGGLHRVYRVDGRSVRLLGMKRPDWAKVKAPT